MNKKLAAYSLVTISFIVLWLMALQPDNILADSPDVGVSAILTPATNGRQFTSSALTSSENVVITVSNFGFTEQGDIPVYYTLNGMMYGPELVTAPIISGTSVVYTFTTVADLSATGVYTITAGTALPDDVDSSNDIITQTLKHIPNPPVNLPFHEGFENTGDAVYQENVIGLVGAEEVDFAHTLPEGRLRTQAGSGYYRTGSHAATLDRYPNGSSQVNYLTLTLNMSNYEAMLDEILLEFSFMHHGEESHPNDRVWIRGTDTLPWIELVDLNAIQGDPGIYQAVSDINISQVLATNGQSFSPSFQLRFGQEDNFASTFITASDGYTFDDIKLRQRLAVDAGPSALVQPTHNVCGAVDQPVVVEVTNFGSSALNDIPVTVDISGAGSGSLSGLASGSEPIGFNEAYAATLGTINTYDGGDFTFIASAAQPDDLAPTNDTLTSSLHIRPVPISIPASEPICPGETASVAVVAEPDTTYAWYDSSTGGNLLATGHTFSTPPILETTTYYVERESVVASVGPVNNTIGNGSYSNSFLDGLIFDVLAPATIEMVYVYPSSTGNVVVRLLDNSNTVLDTRTVFVTTPEVKTAIPLGFDVPVGSGYRLDAEGTEVAGLFRNNSGGTYPYASSVANITGPINHGDGFYYFFYDWRVSATPCASARTPITILVSPSNVHTTVTTIADSGAGSLREALDKVCNGSAVDFDPGLADQTIVLSNGPLQVSKKITIANPHAPNLALSGNHTGTIFHVEPTGDLLLEGFTLVEGLATDLNGGGIYNEGGIVSLSGMTLANNVAQNNGGGIYIDNGGTVNLLNSTLSGNNAGSENGGSIYNDDGIVNIGNSTFSGNVAQQSGGGLYNHSGIVNVSNSTFSANVADAFGLEAGDGGGIFNHSGIIKVQNSIIAGNTDYGPERKHPDVSGDFMSEGYNLIGDNQGLGRGGIPFADGVNGDQVGPDTAPLDPQLDPLTGSPAYHPLQITSPAVDAGNPAGCQYLSSGVNPLFEAADPVTTDQRGFSRLLDAACDTGAFELQAPQLSLTKTIVGYRPRLAQVVTYTIALHNSGSADAIGASLTDTLPSQLDFAAWITHPAGANVTGNEITWLGTVTSGQTITLTFAANVIGDEGEQVVNLVEVSHPASGRVEEDMASFIIGQEAVLIYFPLIMR
jgi:uncharacterized repeat protein (TIGR01451 family)